MKELKLNIISAIKWIATFLLSMAFFLPLSQCSHKEATPDKKPNVEAKADVQKMDITYTYSAYKWPEVGAAVTFLAFFWPLIIGVIKLVWPNLDKKLTVDMVEILFCAGSGYMVYCLTIFDSLLYGGYIAWGAIGIYFISASAALLIHFRDHKAAKRNL